ncbi:glycoside hydrolase family 140 protein [Puia sp.]|uniref:glycoside hydrolase family 140 protein n=1 Tax=Puia sp. TaxID=2045100 RepID=UPI002F3F8963
MPIRLQIYWFALFLLPAAGIAQSIPARAKAAPTWTHGRLRVTPDGHYLQYTDGTPFFWLGDTGWELFHRLTLEEIRTYLDDRAAKGFTVIQAVALAEFDGLRRPNRYGDLPLHHLDPTQPDEHYFSIVDSTVKMAQSRGLFIGLLPTWGDKVTKAWGEGPVIFDSTNAYTYGRWLGNRYKDAPNIIWILGGDRPALTKDGDWRPIWRRMAAGIIAATGHRCLITYHPGGGPNSTSQWIHNEPWLDLNMFQSGHGSGHDTPCWQLVTRDRALSPAKPTLDAEPNYEDHPVNPWPKWNPENGRFNDYDVRKQLYRSVFAGACGVTYGHHAVWQFMSAREEAINYPDRGWLNALQRPGATQAGYLRRLIESRPPLERLPDTALIMDGQGIGGEHAEAFTGAAGDYAMIYLPVGKPVVINPAHLRARNLVAWWFNPRDATAQKIGAFSAGKPLSLTPPSQGAGNDWVLVLDDAGHAYPPPATSPPAARDAPRQIPSSTLAAPPHSAPASK